MINYAKGYATIGYNWLYNRIGQMEQMDKCSEKQLYILKKKKEVVFLSSASPFVRRRTNGNERERKRKRKSLNSKKKGQKRNPSERKKRGLSSILL